MICTSCKNAEAVVFIKNIVDNQVSQAALCLDCAEAAVPLDPASALLKLMAGSHRKPKSAPSRCPGCRGTYAQFKETGRLGCARCYEHFAPLIRQLLPRLHAGAYEHRGKSPKR